MNQKIPLSVLRVGTVHSTLRASGLSEPLSRACLDQLPSIKIQTLINHILSTASLGELRRRLVDGRWMVGETFMRRVKSRLPSGRRSCDVGVNL